MSADTIAILIKTFNRPQRLLPTVLSIRTFCKVPYRLYIGDDGEISGDAQKLYEELARLGHEIVRYKDRMNVTSARNDLVGRLRGEAFVLRLDDDFNFAAETNLGAMLAIMRARPEIGAISDLERQMGDGKKIRSGEISAKQGHMILKDGVLHKVSVPHTDWVYLNAGGQRFAYANFTRNFLLIRREVFDTVKWNEAIVIQGEHTAFMLDLQKAGWALAFTPDSIHHHNEIPLPAHRTYAASRQSDEGRASQQDVFLRDYGIRDMRGLTLSAALAPSLRKKIRNAVRQLTGRR